MPYKEPRKRFYKISELAKILKVTTVTIDRWAKRYKIESVNKGMGSFERRYYRESAIIFVSINKLRKTKRYTMLGIGHELGLIC